MQLWTICLTPLTFPVTQRYGNISVYLYDREYRKLQASYGFRWGADNTPPSRNTVSCTPRNNRKIKSLNVYQPMNISIGPHTLDGKVICKLYNSPRCRGYVDYKFVHACSHKGCNEVHSATVHFSPDIRTATSRTSR